MQTNSRGNRNVIRSSGSFWGKSAPAEPEQVPTTDAYDAEADHEAATEPSESYGEVPSGQAARRRGRFFSAAGTDTQHEPVTHADEVAFADEAAPKATASDAMPTLPDSAVDKTPVQPGEAQTTDSHADIGEAENALTHEASKELASTAEVDITPSPDSTLDKAEEATEAHATTTPEADLFEAASEQPEEPEAPTHGPAAQHAPDDKTKGSPSHADGTAVVTPQPAAPRPTRSAKQAESHAASAARTKQAESYASTEAVHPKPSTAPASADAPTTEEDDSDKPALVRHAKALWKNHRVPTIVGTLVIALLVVTYVAGGVFFSSHFLPRTTVNGNDVSLMSTDDFAAYVSKEANDYTAKVSGDGIDLQIAGGSVGLTLDANTYVRAATSQVPSWAWPVALASEQAYEVDEGVSIDATKLTELLAGAVATANENSTPTTNATIYYDEDFGDFVEVEEKLGTELDAQSVVTKVATNMQGLSPTIMLGDAELVQPTVTAGDERFKAAMAEARDFPDLKLKLVMGGDVVKTLDSDLVRTWLVIDDEFSVTGDADAIAYYTRGTLSSELDSVSGYRTYTRADGKSISVSDGTYGWNIDGAKLAKLIAGRIHDKSAKPLEVPCINSAKVYNPGGADWGNRYIDVDLTEQYARMYDENGDLIWASDCVSGGSAEGNDTVTGVFYIEDKISPMTLIGLDNDGDGEPDYENDVTYWMPFYAGSYGFHDATWRYTFGGEEYLYDGSHGCVNLPYDAAEELYYSVEEGDCVVVHK